MFGKKRAEELMHKVEEAKTALTSLGLDIQSSNLFVKFHLNRMLSEEDKQLAQLLIAQNQKKVDEIFPEKKEKRSWNPFRRGTKTLVLPSFSIPLDKLVRRG